MDKIFLYKKSDNEYVIRYNDVNRINVVPLRLKIKNFLCEIHELKNNIPPTSIQSELFKKLREIWNKIIKLIGINNAKDFVKNTIDHDEFIMLDVHKNTSFVEGNYSDKTVIVLHSIIDNYLKTSLIQAKKQKFKYFNKSFQYI